MKTLVSVSGYTIRKNVNNKLIFVDEKIGWTYTTKYVLGLVALILITVGLATFLYNPGLIGFGIMAIIFGGMVLIAFISLVKHSKNRKKDRHKEEIICIIDQGLDKVTDANGKVIADWSDCRIMKQMQFTSSSPSYVLSTPKGNYTLIKGNPFGGGATPFRKALEREGLL